MELSGVFLPLVTPFLEGEVDYGSYRNLIERAMERGVSGLMPLGTTGESPVITEMEFERILAETVEAAAGRVPVYAGVGGNSTAQVVKKIGITEKYPVQGILSVCPYYNRPDQRGLYRHFLTLSEATDLNIVIYNIPYRTGVNLENRTLLRLAEERNIVGVKDSCGNIGQSLSLLAEKPEGFSVMTGEDILFYTTLANGGDGGILASAHLFAEPLAGVYKLMTQNDHLAALELWRTFSQRIPMLFEEPNPAPVKHCLEQLKEIASGELRLPLTGVSAGLEKRLSGILKSDSLNGFA